MVTIISARCGLNAHTWWDAGVGSKLLSYEVDAGVIEAKYCPIEYGMPAVVKAKDSTVLCGKECEYPKP